MRVRSDFWHDAGLKRAMDLGAFVLNSAGTVEQMMLTGESPEPAQPGDAWIFYVQSGERHRRRQCEKDRDCIVTGYAFTCPNVKCPAGVHVWDHAIGCAYYLTGRCHSGRSSCYHWYGSATDGTLTCWPGLIAPCGWRGMVVDGRLVSDPR